jgi:hypothetical protein
VINKIQPLANRDDLANFWNKGLSTHLGSRWLCPETDRARKRNQKQERYPRRSYLVQPEIWEIVGPEGEELILQ